MKPRNLWPPSSVTPTSLLRSFLVESTAVVDGSDFATLLETALLILVDKKRELAVIAFLRDNIISRYFKKRDFRNIQQYFF